MTEHKKGGGEQTLTVALRIRPLSEDELNLGASQIAHKVQKKMVVLMDPQEDPDDVLRANRSREKKFVYDCTFDSDATQEEVYDSTSSFLIPNVITGYNATVFAYGATGAGKTYTMLGSDNNPGIMARALNDLFLEMEKTKDTMSYRVSMSYLEIYNEMIRDLLSPAAGILDLREDAKGGVQVPGLSEITTRSTDDVMKMLLKGNKERTQEPTAANKTSSRSHAVLQVIIKQHDRVKDTTHEVRTGRLFMVDLAGSERAANTHNKGKRMVEGAHINRSLLALGNCINALSDKNGTRYINYRDSKLTRLLKDALGGNCKTVMIAHISPASLHFEESRNTLVYADRAKHIKTKVRRNVTDVSYHIAQYTNLIQELREEIHRLREKLVHNDGPSAGLSKARASGVQINAVQAEVLDRSRMEDREQLTKVKEQLLISFKDQMELRKSLMELNNASMEISLETNRNQMIISEWEVEKVKNIRREGTDFEAEESKAMDLEGRGSDDLHEPEDVRVARDEIKVLHDEKHRTEKIRGTVSKELEVAKQKTRKLQDTVPQRIRTEDQREILNLLCKVHELEIENTEVQSACLLRDFNIKKKDMVINRYRQHQNLCDDIIKRQRAIFEENNIPCPKDLDELYELYRLEREDRMLLREDSGNFTPEYNYKGPSVTSNRPYLLDDGDQLSTLTEEDARLNLRSGDGDKLFSRSARAQRIQEEGLSANWRNDTTLSFKNTPRSPRLSPTGTPNHFLPPGPYQTADKREIVTNTRQINLKAAKRRSKAQTNLQNLERQYGGDSRSLYRPEHESDAYLSPRTLARHDQHYEESFLPSISKPPSEDNLSTATRHSTSDSSNLPPIRGGIRKANQREADLKRNMRTRGYDNSYASQYRATSRRSVGDKYVRPSGGTGRAPVIDRSKRGQNTSGNSTPQKGKKGKIPTITNYRKENIVVAGFSLPH